MNIVFGKCFVIGYFILLLILYLFNRIKLNDSIKTFFTHSSHPINLSVFRIVVFSSLLLTVLGDFNDITWLSSVPLELRVPLDGYESIINFIPINERFTYITKVLFITFCFMALIGLFTKLSIFLTLLFGLYVLGVPQLFGKIQHIHHLLWFSLILLVSDCNRVLSIDSLINLNPTGIIPKSYSYSLPIRFSWILLGTIYFFPGMWKLWTCGFDWFLSDNIKYIMFHKWSDSGFRPFFRIDHYPALYKLGGLFIIIFEISFIIVIGFKKIRKFAVIGGIIFHLSIYFFMGISFWQLLICYLTFIEYEIVFQKLINKSYIQQLIVNNNTLKNSFFLILIGTVLIASNIYVGVMAIDSWPFAIYPKFNYFPSLRKKSIEIHFFDKNNKEVHIDLKKIISLFKTSRWNNLLQRIALMENYDKQAMLCTNLYKLIVQNYYSEIKQVNLTKFYRVEILTSPQYNNKIISSKLIYSQNVSEFGNRYGK